MVQDQPWSFKGPYRAPKMNLRISENISGCVNLLYIIYSLIPLDILEHIVQLSLGLSRTLKWDSCTTQPPTHHHQELFKGFKA